MLSRQSGRYTSRSCLGVGLVIASALSVPSAQTAAPLKRYLYAASPGIRDYLEFGGHGVVVFDIDNGHKFVNRIPIGGMDDSGKPEHMKGICAHAGTRRLYVSSHSSLMAFDLVTGAPVYTKKFGGLCDRLEVSPDGKTIYLHSGRGDDWYVIDAATGNEIKRISVPGIKAHNTNYGGDGTQAYLAGIGSNYVTVAETKNHTILRKVGPFADIIRPLTHNGKQTLLYVNVNGLLGFEIGDIKTGKFLRRVEVAGFKTGPVERHGCPSHGIALTKDETEVWIVDGFNKYAHVFDNTVMPPTTKASIKLSHEPGWITFGVDNTLAYVSTGDVIDMKTKKVVTTLTDELGRKFESENSSRLFLEKREKMASSVFGIHKAGIYPMIGFSLVPNRAY